MPPSCQPPAPSRLERGVGIVAGPGQQAESGEEQAELGRSHGCGLLCDGVGLRLPSTRRDSSFERATCIVRSCHPKRSEGDHIEHGPFAALRVTRQFRILGAREHPAGWKLDPLLAEVRGARRPRCGIPALRLDPRAGGDSPATGTGVSGAGWGCTSECDVSAWHESGIFSPTRPWRRGWR